MTAEEVLATAQELGPLASFATVGFDGTPHVIPLMPEWIGFELVFGAATESLKVRHLGSRPVAAVQYLTSGEQFPDALLLKGSARVIRDDAARTDLWESGRFPFLPQMYEGPTDELLCFVRFTPTRASLIREAGRGVPATWRA